MINNKYYTEELEYLPNAEEYEGEYFTVHIPLPLPLLSLRRMPDMTDTICKREIITYKKEFNTGRGRYIWVEHKRVVD